jgi:hypothetical protein
MSANQTAHGHANEGTAVFCFPFNFGSVTGSLVIKGPHPGLADPRIGISRRPSVKYESLL